MRACRRRLKEKHSGRPTRSTRRSTAQTIYFVQAVYVQVYRYVCVSNHNNLFPFPFPSVAAPTYLVGKEIAVRDNQGARRPQEPNQEREIHSPPAVQQPMRRVGQSPISTPSATSRQWRYRSVRVYGSCPAARRLGAKMLLSRISASFWFQHSHRSLPHIKTPLHTDLILGSPLTVTSAGLGLSLIHI